ncbi:MAG: hypothetical protein SOI46_08720, partial [Eggerthellaceae bacterium]
PKDGSITYGNGLMPGWTGQPLRQRLKDELGLPAAAMGDVQAHALGEAIGSWCNIIDPECVVLSGTVTKAGPAWRDAIDEGFAAQILQPLSDIPILQGALGGDAPLIGAAENLRDVMQTWALDY